MDNIIKNNKLIFNISLYFILLFLIDYSGITDLYGQSLFRRCINMYRRTDPLCYKNKINPYCVKYEKILSKYDVKNLQSIRIPEKKDTPWFSRKNTTTHQCCDNFNIREKHIIRDISEKIKKKYESKIGKKLYYLQSNKATIYKYIGKNSHHLWHVDPQNLTEIYNIIVCIKKKGNISPLQCKYSNGKKHSIYFKEGDSALFNGGTTIHQVPPNNDPNSERTVLSIAFTSDKKISKNKNNSNNLCTYIEGGNNYKNLLKIFFKVFIINFILSNISKINDIDYKEISILFLLTNILVKYLPLYYDIRLGSGRSSSIIHNFVLLLVSIISTFSIKGGTIFITYFLLSYTFFSKNWVAYD
jgi:hypothetical protein